MVTVHRAAYGMFPLVESVHCSYLTIRRHPGLNLSQDCDNTAAARRLASNRISRVLGWGCMSEVRSYREWYQAGPLAPAVVGHRSVQPETYRLIHAGRWTSSTSRRRRGRSWSRPRPNTRCT